MTLRVQCSYMQGTKHDQISLCICHGHHRRYLCEMNQNKGRLQHLKTKTRIRLRSPHNTNLTIAHQACPKGHLTHDFLVCDSFADCWDSKGSDVGNDILGVRTASFCLVNMTSVPPLFSCKKARVKISYSMVCNSRVDCPDSSDEKFCSFPPCAFGNAWHCKTSSGQVSYVIFFLLCGVFRNYKYHDINIR